MKKFSVALILTLIIFCSAIQTEAAKKTVAVTPFEGIATYEQYEVGAILTEQLINVIHSSRQFTVVENTQMQAVLQRMGFDNLSGNTAVEFGNLTGANYTIVGKVTMAAIEPNTTRNVIDGVLGLFGKRSNATDMVNPHRGIVEFDARFVDNETGEILFANTFRGSDSAQSYEQALHSAARKAAESFLVELQNLNPFAARVVEISGNLAYIDQGSDSGLRVGDKMEIFREGPPIIINGRIVGTRDEKVTKGKIVEVYPEYAVCKVDKAQALRKDLIVKREQRNG